jgi:hypothetical protein
MTEWTSGVRATIARCGQWCCDRGFDFHSTITRPVMKGWGSQW